MVLSTTQTSSLIYTTQNSIYKNNHFEASFGYLPGLGNGHPFFSKERNVLAFFSVLYKRTERFFVFFSVLYKRTEHSLLSFTFFIKERIVFYGFISHTKIANLAKKRMLKNAAFLFIRLKRT